ncbi:ankyrin repeat protein (macronuclear) [Tetrahymena thermophila SB210]|uniref:Ankyrin repeat protein n=1 Tax=Tetrahymena thermophila (strain SB210) TaxID=312017 RepID=I7LX56_TETTS|nr:ankyrin repeat protein [Tetrahymena thermophila SB210]EAS03797.2 ankyrin repeat protein [Tetrahymena thermophila SB210]|eukprot:XP_001024042.2 ankyrin repeat protein [Tetrahymena thermophila SB210]
MNSQEQNLNKQQQQQLHQQQQQQQQLLTTKDSSQNRNIENFLNKSNKYSRESLQFLQEKNTLLLQQQLLPQAPRFKQQPQKEDVPNEVNKIYEIRTQFNKFEQENRGNNAIQGFMIQNNPFANTTSGLSREDVLVDANNVANEDLDEVQESEQFTVSSKMRTLQNTSKQTFSISKVELKNLVVPPLPENLINISSNQDLHQGDRQSVNTYVLSPNISARTLMPNSNNHHFMSQQQLKNAQPQNQLHQKLDNQAVKQDIRNQIGQFQPHQMPLQIQSQNTNHQSQKISQQNQQHQPLFFNPPSTPEPGVSINGINVTTRGRLNGNLGNNINNNHKSSSNSLNNTQRTIFGNTSSINLNAPLSANSQYSVNKSLQSLGYAVNLVNKNIEDLSKHVSTMNPNTLQILDLSSNKISNFPVELYQMKNLKRLKLESNLIKILPKEIFLELKLESFSVQNNLIQDIPHEITEWKNNLQCLNISRNHIHTFQKYICYLDGINSLNVSSNDFMEIPIEFIFLVNLKEFSIDWFKYCLPPKKPTVQGNEGLQVLKEIFLLLCNHRSAGFVTFLQFTTHFSDKNLIKISSQIKKNKPKTPIQKKVSSPNSKNQNVKSKQNIENEEQRKHRLQQLEILANQQNQENRFVLNVSNTNLLNTTITSLNESQLPKENDGIQYLPEELKKKKNRLLCINKKAREEDSILDNSRSLVELINLKQIQSSNNQPLSSKRQVKSNANLQISGQVASGVCKTLINFSSESDLSFGQIEEVLHTHHDLGSCQEQLHTGRNSNNLQSAHPLKNKKTPKNLQNPGQIIKTDENVNFDKILQEVEEENEEKNNQIIFQHLDIKLENPPDQLLSQREQKFMQKPFEVNEENEIDNLCDEQEIIDLDQTDQADENIISESKEEQPKSAQFIDITTPKVYTQYNQIDPKNGRNLMHLAVIDEDISSLRCLVNLNFDLVNEVDFDGQTPLSLSILEEKYYSAKILIFNKANVNVGGGVFGSNVTIGVVKMQYYLIRDLIRFGADVNKQDHDGNGPLHYLFQQYYRNPEESSKIAQMLLDNGANPNLENNEKWSPLHFAVRRGCLEAVEFAFEYNRMCLAKKNKRGFMINKAGGNERITILHIASEMNFQKIVQLLLKNNADIFARRSDNKLSYQLCQKHTLVKKLLLLSQTNQINSHLNFNKFVQIESYQDSQEAYENKFIEKQDDSFERYKKKNNKRNKKGASKKSNKNKNHKKQENQEYEIDLVKIKEEDDDDDEVYGDEEEVNFDSENDNDGVNEDDDEQEDEFDQSGNYSSNDEDGQVSSKGDENLVDSADSFPVDMEDEDKNIIKQRVQNGLKNLDGSIGSSKNLLKNKLNMINVSSQPRMIKTGDIYAQQLSKYQLQEINNQFVNYKDKNGWQGPLQEMIENQLNDREHSLDEIEDEDLKGDVPKWFYKDHSQIPYSPNNLQKIQGMNEIISQIIQQNSSNVSINNKYVKSQFQQSPPLIFHHGIKTPELVDNRISLFNNNNNNINANQNKTQVNSINQLNYNPNIQQHMIQQQLQYQSSKTQTIQACNFFSNLKNYKQVIKSASNINEYQLKILDDGLALTNRLYFLNQLKFIQFKLVQILKLITRQNIYQLFCRSGIIEDFLKLGDDNLNTLINTSQEFNRSIVFIYRKLAEQPSFDNNNLMIQIVNLFGDTCYHLYILFYDKQTNSNTSQKQQSQLSSQTTLALPINDQNIKSNEITSANSLKENTDAKNIIAELKKQTDELFPTFAKRMKIDYSKNILKDYLELQQATKIKKDNFTQKTLITDQDFDRMMPTEEEYETENEELTKVLQNYAQIKLRSNPLQEIPKQNKIFK